jgi:hypothetical protein
VGGFNLLCSGLTEMTVKFSILLYHKEEGAGKKSTWKVYGKKEKNQPFLSISPVKQN